MALKVVSIYLFIAVILTAWMTTYTLHRSRSENIRAFVALCACVTVYLLGYLAELNSGTLQSMMFWNQIQYFGIPFISAFWVMVALLYTNRTTNSQPLITALVFSIPVMTLLIRSTNHLHGLYYSSFSMASQSGFMLLVLERGPWYYVQNVYALMCLLAVSYLFYNKYRSSVDLDRTRFTVLLLASIIPYLGITMIIGSFMGISLDYTAIVMPISLVLMMYSILRFDFLEIKALARDTIFEISDDGMILLDNENFVLDYNQSARHILDLPSMTIKDRGLTAILDHRESLIEPLTDHRSRQITLGEGDQERFYEVHSSQIAGPRGHQIGVLKSIRDITDKKKLQDHLERMATIDELSGLLNRGQFIRVAQLELNRTRRYEGNMAIMMMDLDHFKGVNDTWGHAAGDAVIAQFGKLLEASFRSSDVCGRMGGEEFAVLLTNSTAKAALRAAERFRKKVEATSFLYRSQEIRLTVSIGISEITDATDTLDTILSEADEGAYESKAAGRNRVTLRHVNDKNRISGCT